MMKVRNPVVDFAADTIAECARFNAPLRHNLALQSLFAAYILGAHERNEPIEPQLFTELAELQNQFRALFTP